MRVQFRKRRQGDIEFGIIYGLIVLFFLVVARLFPVLQLAPDCAFHGLTGFPCPTCGSTRSIVLFSHGRFLPSFAINPLMFVATVTAILAFFYGLLTLLFGIPRMSYIFSPLEKRLVRSAAILAVLANWFYVAVVL